MKTLSFFLQTRLWPFEVLLTSDFGGRQSCVREPILGSISQSSVQKSLQYRDAAMLLQRLYSACCTIILTIMMMITTNRSIVLLLYLFENVYSYYLGHRDSPMVRAEAGSQSPNRTVER